MKKRFLIITFALSLLFVGLFGYFSSRVYVNAQEQFATSGYILASSDDPESVNKQCYFTEGTKYKQSYTGNVSFTDINNDKVTIDSKVFVHYDNDALFGLNDSVIMDTDNINSDQISYYSITSDSVLSKQGNSYTTSNAGNQINFTNFIWKISPERYMIVSPEITLCVSEESQQTFNNYIELEYVDAGVAHLINKEGTYSTVSSDAFLLLQNGIRVYIGSKNISTEEGIIMNLTQMVVDSDDNIEIVPDEEYTVEVDKQPHIVVNATDGESGEEGKQGNAGEAGDPGNPGAKGNQGSGGRGGTEGEKGDVGQDALYSGVTYVQQYIPHFALKDDLDITAYGVNGSIDYTNVYAVETDASGNEIPKEIEMDTSGKTVDFMIIEQATSKIVWKRSINPQDLVLYTAGTNYLTGDLNNPITSLKQNTNYALVINARFKPVKPVDFDDDNTNSFYNQFITQQVLSQPFTTQGYGVSIILDHTTSDSICANLTIDKEAAQLINSMDVGLYNEMLASSELTCNNDYELNITSINTESFDKDDLFTIDNNGTIKFTGIKTLPEEFEYPVVVTLEYKGHLSNNLKRNHSYYLRINDVYLIEDEALAIYPSNGFEYIEAKTLKQLPIIGAPTLQISKDTSSVSVTPGYIEDLDSGIQKYRYEFYKITKTLDQEGKDIKEYELAYTYDTTSTDIFSVPLNSEGLPEVNNNLVKGNTYCVKAVAIFDNNQNLVDVASDLSNELDTGSTYEWPKSYIEFKTYISGEYKDMSAPTIIDGEAHITDEQLLITKKSRIIIKYEAKNDTQSSTFEESKGEYVVENVDALATGKSYEQGEYEIPFVFEALKANTTYQISIIAEEMKVDGAISGNITLCNEIIKTSDYAPLLLSGKDLHEENSKNLFNVRVYFSLDNVYSNNHSYKYEEDSLLTFSNYGQEKLGLKNTLDLTAKSMTAVAFDVYSAIREDGVIKPVSKLNEKSYVVYSPLKDGIYDYSTNYYRNYGNKNAFYTGAYATGLMNYLTVNTISQKQDVIEWLSSNYSDSLVDFLKTDSSTIDLIGKGKNFTNEDVKILLNKPITGDSYFNHIKSLIQNEFSNNKYKLNYSDVNNIGMPSDYEYSVIINDKSFNDDSLEAKITSFKSINKENAYLLIKANYAYDYTYGRGNSSTKVFDNANLISIGTNSSTCDGTIYDQYVECGISNKIPAWEDGKYYFKTPAEKITKGYYFDKNNTEKLYEEVNTNSGNQMYSNLFEKENGTYQIKEETRNKVTSYWKEKINTTTTTGIVLEGNSDWLSGYSKAIRYIVYDKNGNEVTRSYNNSTLTTKYYTGKNGDEYEIKEEVYGEGGWLETNIGQPLPKWVFYFDQPYTYQENIAEEGQEPVYENKTGYIRRGDEFTVVTQVLLKEIVEDSLNNIDYLFPRFDENVEGVPCVMKQTFSYVKQEPVINAYQYKGTSPKEGTETSNDIYYAIIKDTDNTILNAEKDLDGNFTTFTLAAKETAESTSTVPVNATITKLSLKDTKNADIPNLYKLELNSDYNSLYVEYDLNDKNNFSIDPLKIEFANDNQISSGEEVSFIKNKEAGETEYTDKFKEYINFILDNYETSATYNSYIKTLLDNKKLDSFIVIPKGDSYFQFYALLNPVNVDKIKKVDITFTNVEDSKKTKTFNFGINDFKRADKTIDNMSVIILGHSDIGPNPNFEKSITYTDIDDICSTSGVSKFDVSMKVYYETSNYGVYYTSITDMKTEMGSQYDNHEHYYRYEPRKLSDGSSYSSGSVDIINFLSAQEAYLVKTKERKTGEYFYEDTYSIGIGKLEGTAFDGFIQDINSTGLNFIPKEVTTVKLNTGYEVEVKYVKPKATITKDSPGMYFAKFNVKLDSLGTLVKEIKDDVHNDGTIEIVLTEKGTSNTITKYVDISQGELNWNINFNDLNSGTEYLLDVYGYLLIDGETKREKLNSSPSEIKTLIELGVDLNECKTEYTFSPESRDSKGIDINVQLNNVYISDVRKGVKNSFVEVYEVDDYYDNWTPTEGEKTESAYYSYVKETNHRLDTLKPISKDELINIFEKQNLDEATAAGNTYVDGTNDYVAKNYVINSEIEWSPGEKYDKDGNYKYCHILDGTHKYVVFFGVNYGNDTSSVLNIKQFKFTNNNKYDEKVSFRTIGSGSVETIDLENVFKVKYTISGTDSRRLLTGYNKVDVSYLVMLYKMNADGVAVPVDIDDGDSLLMKCPNDEIHKVKVFDASCFASSTISTNPGAYIESKTFETVAERNTEYFVKIYSVLDLENKDIEGINVGDNKLIHKESDKDYYVFDGFDDLNNNVAKANKTGVYYSNNKTAYYVYVSGRTKTPSSATINVENVNIIPDINRVAIYGTGLEKVDQVVYQLTTINADGSEIPSETITYNIENGFNNKWKESASGQSIYNLTVEQMQTNVNRNYYIAIQLYSYEKISDDEGQYVLACTTEGSYLIAAPKPNEE